VQLEREVLGYGYDEQHRLKRNEHECGSV